MHEKKKGAKRTPFSIQSGRSLSTSCLSDLREQEAAFRKVVQATMVRDRQHGPVVELNRIQVRQTAGRFPSMLYPKVSVAQTPVAEHPRVLRVA